MKLLNLRSRIQYQIHAFDDPMIHFESIEEQLSARPLYLQASTYNLVVSACLTNEVERWCHHGTALVVIRGEFCLRGAYAWRNVGSKWTRFISKITIPKSMKSRSQRDGDDDLLEMWQDWPHLERMSYEDQRPSFHFIDERCRTLRSWGERSAKRRPMIATMLGIWLQITLWIAEWTTLESFMRHYVTMQVVHGEQR